MAKGKKMTWREKQELFHSSADYRKEVFEGLLKHLADGYSIDCYSGFSEPTIMEAAKKYPLEFDLGAIHDAQMDGKAYWETLGKRQADGSCMGNSRTWYYNMAHRYRWSDRQQIDHNVNGQLSVNVVNYHKQSHRDEGDGE